MDENKHLFFFELDKTIQIFQKLEKVLQGFT